MVKAQVLCIFEVAMHIQHGGIDRPRSAATAGDQYHLAVVIQPRVTTHGTLLMLVLRATLGAKLLGHVV